jgi:signal transduction histidine kinase/DNA-binding response OmpR family regulator/HAMP domain-containing protein
MKIKTKFLLGLSSQPILLILLIVIGWYQLSSLNQLSESTQSDYEISLLAEQIQKEIKDEAIILRNIVIFQEEEALQKELNLLQRKSNSVTQNIALLETRVMTSDQTLIVENLKQLNQDFNIYLQEVIQLVSEGNKEEAAHLINQNGHKIQGEILNAITVMTDHFQSNMNSTFKSTTDQFRRNIILTSLISLILIVFSVGLALHTVWRIASRLSKVSNVMRDVTSGHLDLKTKIEVKSNDEIDEVADSFNKMTHSLEEQRLIEKNMTWAKSNIADIATSLSGIHQLKAFSRMFLSKIVPLMGSCQAVFYLKDPNHKEADLVFNRLASYAYTEGENNVHSFKLGEGLVGQAALEQKPIILTDIPDDYIRVKSGLGEASPQTMYILPISFEGNVIAVLEMATFTSFSTTQQNFLEEMCGGLGIILESVIGRLKLANLLEETQELMEEIQAQSEELQSQQEELRVTNEELEAQTHDLRQSEEKLQVQQEELEQMNTELKEKAKSLEEQNKRFEETNREVERARADLEEKAKQLELTSKYKSEFLANMSHELRTPLNSLLILSKLLADNKDGNLSDKQVEYSNTIYSSGRDLLSLINDILDLAKIEAGKQDIHPQHVKMNDLVRVLEERFTPIAAEKELSFSIENKVGNRCTIFNDEKRMLQVLENLLSNAFKFTHRGGVCLEIESSSGEGQSETVSFKVKDTGIGIPSEKQELIFQAFQQADGTTSRKYGGTGLGLSICREIAELLGGHVYVESEEGKGSNFIFQLSDYEIEAQTLGAVLHLDEVAATVEDAELEASIIIAEEPSKPIQKDLIKRLLIVDDDLKQRNSLMELIGGMDIIIKAVSNGKEALEELKIQPFDLMILDLGLSDTSGTDLLKKIKTNGANDQITVLVYTGRELTSKEEVELTKYAHTIIVKNEHSVDRLIAELDFILNTQLDEKTSVETVHANRLQGLEGKKILLVDDDVRNVYALSSFLELYGMDITFAENGIECLEILKDNPDFDLILMDIMMPEMDGYETIRALRKIPEFVQLPIIALTAKAMKEEREKGLQVGASDYIVKPFDPDQLLSLIHVWVFTREGDKKWLNR